MAAVINVRDTFLQSETRTNDVVLPPGISIDYSQVENAPPERIPTISTSDPTGGSDGDTHFNSSTNVLWVKIDGTWTKGGTVNASQITTGTLAAARIGASTITASKLSVSTLSAITANLGSVTAGHITGTANIDITGQARFKGQTSHGGSNYAVVVNESLDSTRGLVAIAPSGSLNIAVNASLSGTSAGGFGVNSTVTNSSATGVHGSATGSNGRGVNGHASGSGGVAVRAEATGSATLALAVIGQMTISSTSLVTNLNADMLDGKHATSLCSKIVCNSGTANASGDGFTFSSTVAGTRTVGSSNSLLIESTSDIRLKQDIESEKLGLDFIRQLKPVTYRMKDDPDILYHGFIAQDMEGLINLEDNDCLYRKNSQGLYGVDYTALIAPVIKAIQELDKKIGKLNKK